MQQMRKIETEDKGMKSMIASYTLLGMLGMCSVEDLKRKEIACIRVLLFGVVGVALHLYQGEISVYDMLLGACCGLVIMLFSYLSGGMIGMGDGLVIVVTGIFLGGRANIRMLCGGVFMAGIISLFLILFRKKKRKDSIPFVPCLFLAYVGMMLI